jgi:aminoglycoside 3-N-acetyltransferase
VSGEAESMAKQEMPVTVDSIVRDLRALGVEEGMTLVVHSSLKSLGWVSGGAQAVVLALQEVLGDTGTLVMPTHTGHLSDPGQWQHPPPRDPSWVPIIRETMPAYDPELTLPRQMGAIVESFRGQREVVRSWHPHMSFAARGPNADRITQSHSLEYSLGEQSPLARVYELEGWVLLLGVPHSNNTSIHLAEYRVAPEKRKHTRQGAPLVRDGRREWVWFDDVDTDSDPFDEIGADFASDTGLERVGNVGSATARLMPQRPLVDYAVQWLERRR